MSAAFKECQAICAPANQTQTMRGCQRATRRPNMLSRFKMSCIKAKRRQCADCGVLTAAVSVGTDHRPFWCLLTDAPFGLIAVYIITTSSDFSTEESYLLRVSAGSQSETALRESQQHETPTEGEWIGWAREDLTLHECWLLGSSTWLIKTHTDLMNPTAAAVDRWCKHDVILLLQCYIYEHIQSSSAGVMSCYP